MTWLAHGPTEEGGGLLFGLMVAASVVAVGVYLIGVRRLWRSTAGRQTIRPWQPAALIAGVGVGLTVTSGPIDHVVHELFSAHMAQHLVLAFVVAPLIVLSRPLLVGSVALGAYARSTRRLRRWSIDHRNSVGLAVGLALFHVATWYLWHLPGAYELALESSLVHVLEHLMLVLSGVTLAWHAFLAHPGTGAMLGATISMVGMIPLAALLVFTNRYWYTTEVAYDYGFTPLEDQQLGGALMWFPGSVIYLGAIVLIAYRRITSVPGRQPATPHACPGRDDRGPNSPVAASPPRWSR